MSNKTERVELRMSPEQVREVDAWRRQQEDLPSRSEAVRRLMLLGLETEKAKT